MTAPARQSLAATTGARLRRVAQALNDLQDAGVRVGVAHGAVLTDYGFLIQDECGAWGVRMKVVDPHMKPVGDPDDD